jgi:hypothetical protein
MDVSEPHSHPAEDGSARYAGMGKVIREGRASSGTTDPCSLKREAGEACPCCLTMDSQPHWHPPATEPSNRHFVGDDCEGGHWVHISPGAKLIEAKLDADIPPHLIEGNCTPEIRQRVIRLEAVAEAARRHMIQHDYSREDPLDRALAELDKL